jgi:hypothetical protein
LGVGFHFDLNYCLPRLFSQKLPPFSIVCMNYILG